MKFVNATNLDRKSGERVAPLQTFNDGARIDRSRHNSGCSRNRLSQLSRRLWWACYKLGILQSLRDAGLSHVELAFALTSVYRWVDAGSGRVPSSTPCAEGPG
jgi:hypothetical protein